MRLPFLSTILLAGALVAAGCVAKDDAGTPPESPAANSADLSSASASNATAPTPAANTTASGNGTASGNSTNMPSDPSNCMRGMDMDGCTAAQADAYFDARKANAPPPDKELPPVLIALDPQGANPSGAFTLDAGTMTLLVEIHLTNVGPGPYAALGPDGTGDLVLNFVGPDGSTAVKIPGLNVGADPAEPLAVRTTATLSMPTIGDWTLTLEGQGTNAQVEILLVERFYM